MHLSKQIRHEWKTPSLKPTPLFLLSSILQNFSKIYTQATSLHITSLGDPMTLIHHIVILLAFPLGLFYEYGTFYMGSFMINEMTTPFLNFIWFMKKMGMKGSNMYKVNVQIFATFFFLFRVCVNTALVEHMTRGFFRFYPQLISRQNLPLLILYFLPVLAWIHFFINLRWFYLIILSLRASDKKKKEQ